MLISKQLPVALDQIEEEKKDHENVEGGAAAGEEQQQRQEADSGVYSARNASHEEEGVDDSSEDVE